MKFKKYLIEKNNPLDEKLMKKYNIRKKDIDVARKELSKKFKVQEKYMVFAFIWEVKENIVFISFNVEDKDSKSYRSTVNYQWMPLDKRGT